MGLGEFGVIGLVLLLILGGKKLSQTSKNNQRDQLAGSGSKKEMDLKANFQQANTKYPESPKPEAPKA